MKAIGMFNKTIPEAFANSIFLLVLLNIEMMSAIKNIVLIIAATTIKHKPAYIKL